MISITTDSLIYIAFLAIGPFLLRNDHKSRKYIFLAMNLLLYLLTIKSGIQLVIVAAWVLTPYFLAGPVSRYRDGRLRPLLIALMTVVFIYLMQYGFISDLFHIPFILGFKILGLSYFLFREIDFIMHYEYLEEEGVRVSLPDYLNYILDMYTLLAGPILRYQEFTEDFYKEQQPLDKEEIFSGINRVVNGFLKVYVLSAFCGYWAGKWFDGLTGHSGALTATAAFCVFALFNGWYIYFNFSGYCDIVIGFGALAGFKIHENFNRPYLARSVVEFWNRHHITLSEWIRDYIYSPLFKCLISSRFGKNLHLMQYISLFVTFAIAGIWHGTDINYLIYGMCQGLGIVLALIIKKFRKEHLTKEQNKFWTTNKVCIFVQRCVTWGYICLTFSFVGYDVVGFLTR
ncbi:MAG: hypothetical protein K6G42_02185 [Lachnospiraceae bacterium]|nr:hypothetical protein [Lachnospiraceae bacterium]